MTVSWAPGQLSEANFRQRRNACTAEQLGALLTSPEFHEWQLRKAAVENRWRTASNAALAVACVLVVVALALLKPPTGLSAGGGAHSPSHSTLLAAPLPEVAGAPATGAPQAVPQSSELSSPIPAGLPRPSAAQQHEEGEGGPQQDAPHLAQLQHELRVAREELEAALDITSDLALALQAARVAPAPLTISSTGSTCQQPPARSLEAEPTAQLLPLNEGLPPPASAPAYPNATLAALWWGLDAGPKQHQQPHAAETSNAAAAGAALALALAACAMAAAAYLRGARAVHSLQARAEEMCASLADAAFERDTAEQSLTLLEGELQRKMQQLEQAQQRASAAAGTLTSPGSAGLGATPGAALTPARGELPPPPGRLVERFLQERNAVAVEREQMQAWLEMEGEYAEMQEAMTRLRGAVAERDEQLQAYEQDADSMAEHMNMDLRARDEQLGHLRAWLDEAQGELMSTQAALQEREAECRRLAALVAGVGQGAESARGDTQEGTASAEAALLQRSLMLAEQLEGAAGALEGLQEQASCASAALVVQEAQAQLLEALSGDEEGSGASTGSRPDTPADLASEVSNVLELMRATRLSLADRLAHSQAACDTMEAELAAKGAPGGQAVASDAADDSSHGCSTAGCSAGEQAEEACPPMVLGVSQKHNIATAASPTKPHGVKAGGAATPSMRRSWEEARERVRAVQQQCSGWDLAGFVQQLGFSMGPEGELESAATMDRQQFETMHACATAALEAAKRSAQSASERALAGAALQALHGWECPVRRVSTPPPSPHWFTKLTGMR